MPLAGLALAAALLTLLFALFEDDAPTAPAPVPAAKQAAPVAAAPAQPAPAPAPQYLTPVRGAAPIELAPPYEVDDGLTIRTETQSVRLAGLEGPTAEAACFDPEQKLWACGLQARAALYNAIRRENVTCRPVEPAGGRVPLVQCSVGKDDLARILVAKGFARPNVERGADIRQALEQAKRNNLGLWNGGWRIRGAS
jgi:endonuclease YncB( thermonuclease family)